MPHLQIVDANFAYELAGTKPPPAQTAVVSPSPATQQSEPAPELHPWLKNTFLGSVIGGIAGTGTAVAVSHFLDRPLNTLNKAKVGGLQGVFSGASGAVAASFAPDRTTGTVVGGVTGAAVGALQALVVSPSKGKVMMGALTGLVSGAAAGHVTVAWREHQQKKGFELADSGAVPEDIEAPFDENAPLNLPFPVKY